MVHDYKPWSREGFEVGTVSAAVKQKAPGFP
jgi:hypothetical protein